MFISREEVDKILQSASSDKLPLGKCRNNHLELFKVFMLRSVPIKKYLLKELF